MRAKEKYIIPLYNKGATPKEIASCLNLKKRKVTNYLKKARKI